METKDNQNIYQFISKYFISGLVILFPLLITIYVIQFIFGFADKFLSTPFAFLPFTLPTSVSLVISILIIVAFGYFATNVFLNKFFHWAEEEVFLRVPVVKTIYSTAKQLNQMLFKGKNQGQFRKVCLIPYPHEGVFTIAFLTNRAHPVIEKKTGKKLMHVFVPSTPTPATGFMVLVPEEKIKLLDISLDEAVKIIISGGVINPETKS